MSYDAPAVANKLSAATTQRLSTTQTTTWLTWTAQEPAQLHVQVKSERAQPVDRPTNHNYIRLVHQTSCSQPRCADWLPTPHCAEGHGDRISGGIGAHTPSLAVGAGRVTGAGWIVAPPPSTRSPGSAPAAHSTAAALPAHVHCQAASARTWRASAPHSSAWGRPKTQCPAPKHAHELLSDILLGSGHFCSDLRFSSSSFL